MIYRNYKNLHHFPVNNKKYEGGIGDRLCSKNVRDLRGGKIGDFIECNYGVNKMICVIGSLL